jgi:hypothetical protein
VSSDVTARLARLEERLDALAAALGDPVHPDDVASARSVAEDGLARAGNAQAIAEDALERGAESDGRAVDALARAGNAQAIAEDAAGRASEVEGKAVDALARADNAQTVADRISARLVEAEGRGADALERSGNAQAIAEDALARAAEAARRSEDAALGAENALSAADSALHRLADREGTEADALARADNARVAVEELSARLVDAEGKGADAFARAGNAQAIAEDALGRAAEAARRSEDAALGAENAVTAADSALHRLADREGREADALARADRAQAIAADAIERAAGAAARADDAAATATLARDVALEALMPARMAAFDAWLQLSPPPADLTLSVVLPTRDRPALLARAVASVIAQRYPSWQLVVVDDGDTGAVAETLATVQDARIAVVEGPRRGLGAARNAGLDAATGDVVCYLDDDNVMHPGWLCAVARVFAERGDVDVAYGVTVAEHRAPGGSPGEGWWPSFWQLPWSREALLEQNLTDAGAIAHRRGLAEARFDEDGLGEDWDLLIRLTAERPALAVPAVSHAYSMSGGDHMRKEAGYSEGLDEVRRRHAGE